MVFTQDRHLEFWFSKPGSMFSQNSLSCHLLICNNSKSHLSSLLFMLCLQIDSELDRKGAAKSLKCCLWDFWDVRQEPGRQCSFSDVYSESKALPLSYGELVSECSAMWTPTIEVSSALIAKAGKEKDTWHHYWNSTSFSNDKTMCAIARERGCNRVIESQTVQSLPI